jgi:tripartite-type tricarboxylate transporter receptor subunit TctC
MTLPRRPFPPSSGAPEAGVAARSTRIARLARIASTVGLAACAAVASAQVATSAPAAASVRDYPSAPIRIVVPFTPGGSTDILARAIGQKLTQAWGQPVIVENVPGAGGAIGAERVARAAPDGYTLLMGHIGTLAVNPSLYPKLPYDPVRSFAPVAWVARVPNVLVVHPSVPAKTVAELVALAKARPGTFNYGSGGNGSAANLAGEYFNLRTGSQMVHVPYRGTAPAVTDLAGGQIQVMFTGAPAVMPQVKAGQLRALAVSSAQRMAALPQLPTVAESGYADFEADQWYGVVAPAGTPGAVVAKLNTAINQSLASPELAERLRSEGAEATPTTPEAFGELIRREIGRWKPVIQSGRVKAD